MLKSLRTITLAAGLVVSLGVAPRPASGQAGTLDPTFGTGGVVTSSIGPPPGTATLDASGNILIAGTSAAGQPGQIVRFLANGQFDTSFGNAGVVKTSSPMQISTITVQADGKIIVGGFTDAPNATEYFALARFNTNGTPDTTFGTGGLVVTPFAPPIVGGGVQVVLEQPDGKIVAAGANVYSVVVRYNSDGSIDDSFGSGGVVQGVPGSEIITAMALQSNGTILLSWAASEGLRELSPTGEHEPVKIGTIVAVAGFMQNNGDVLQLYNIAQNEGAAATRTLGRARPLSQAPTRQEVELRRFLTNGEADPAFNGPEFYWQSQPAADLDLSYMSSVAFPSNGQIVAAGWSTTAAAGIFALARFSSTGSFDRSFGSGGVATTKILDNCSIQHVLIQSSGNLVAIGLASDAGATSSDLALARYQSE
jgi:uncharacterized delta-60 repeat protein